MFYHDLDDLPNDVLPKHLITISQEDFERAKKTRESSKFLLAEDKHYLVMPTQDEAKNHPVIKTIYEQGYLEPNKILMTNQYRSDANSAYYLPYDMVAEQSIEAQMQNFPALCQHLGAKRIKFTLSEQLKEDISMNASLEGKIKAANVGVGASYGSSAKTSSNSENETHFEGSDIDLQAAENLMATDLFKTNKHIIGFYNTAKNINNRMKSQKVRFGMNQEVQKQFDAFLNADVPFLKTIINASAEAQMERCQSYWVEYEVEF